MALKKKLSEKLFSFVRGGFTRLWNQNQNRLQWALLSMVILDVEPKNIFTHEPRAIEMFQILKQKTENIFSRISRSRNEFIETRALRYLLECNTENHSESGTMFSLETFFHILQG